MARSKSRNIADLIGDRGTLNLNSNSLSATFTDIDLTGTGSITIPSGTTSQRDVSPANGMMRFNTTLSQFEGYKDGAWAEIGGGSSDTWTTDNFTGNGSTAAYTLTQAPSSEDNVIAFIEGVFQNPADYVVSGTTITFDENVPNGQKVVVHTVKATVAGNNLNLDEFTGNGSNTQFTLSINPIDERNTMVYIDGVYQNKDTYSLANQILHFCAAPASSAEIEVLCFTQTSINTPTSNSVGTAALIDDSVTSAKLGHALTLQGNTVIDGSMQTENISIPDNYALRLGSGQDLQLYHDGSQSIIQDVGTGQLKILGENTIHIGSATGTHSYIRALKSGAVELYYNNIKKLETTSSGVTANGTIIATTFTGNLTGNVTGDLTGNVTGNVTGDLTGDVTGNLTGDVTGDVTGNVTGNVNGELTGTINAATTATTQANSVANTTVATTAFVSNKVTELIGGAPGTLDTLNELAAAINDDANYNSTLTTALATKLPLAGGALTGTLTSNSHIQMLGNLDVKGQIGAYDNTASSWGKMILRATDFEFKNAGGTIVGSIDTSSHFRIVNDLQMDSTSPRIDYDNGDSNGSLRFFSTSSNVERMRLTAAGRLGINAVNPQHDLVIHNDSGPFIALVGDSYNDEMGIVFNGGDLTNASSAGNTGAKITSQLGVNGGQVLGDLRFTTNSGDTWIEAMRMDTSGNIGINAAAPTEKLEIDGGVKISSSNSRLYFGAKAGTSYRALEGANDGSLLQVGEGFTNIILQGNVGAGTTISPSAPIHITTGDGTTNSAVNSLMITNLSSGTTTTGFGGEIRFQAQRNNGVNQNTGGIRSIAEVNSGSNISSGMAFDTSAVGVNSEKLRITFDGDIGIGTDSPSFYAFAGDTNQRGLEISNPNNDSSAQLKLTGRNNTGTPGQATSFEIGHRGDSLRTTMRHGGADLIDINSSSHIHLNPGNSSSTQLFIGGQGGYFGGNSSHNMRAAGAQFMFNAGGSTGNYIFEANGQARLTIDNLGVHQIKTNKTADNYDLYLKSQSSADPGLAIFRDGQAGFGISVRTATTNYTDFILSSGGSPDYAPTSVGGSGQAVGIMRMHYSGSVSMPYSAAWSSGIGHIFGNTGNHYMVRTSTSTGNETMIISNTVGTGGATGILQYRNLGAVRGDYLIADNTNGIYFQSASDYRFKENVTDIPNGYLNKLTSLRPVTYTHSADMDDDTTTVHTGLIAHEVAEVFPEFVLGEKDAVYTQEDLDARGDPTTVNESVGDPLYQTIAYSKKEWNIYIIKALQELKAENEALKARIETLEG